MDFVPDDKSYSGVILEVTVCDRSGFTFKTMYPCVVRSARCDSFFFSKASLAALANEYKGSSRVDNRLIRPSAKRRFTRSEAFIIYDAEFFSKVLSDRQP